MWASAKYNRAESKYFICEQQYYLINKPNCGVEGQLGCPCSVVCSMMGSVWPLWVQEEKIQLWAAFAPCLLHGRLWWIDAGLAQHRQGRRRLRELVPQHLAGDTAAKEDLPLQRTWLREHGSSQRGLAPFQIKNYNRSYVGQICEDFRFPCVFLEFFTLVIKFSSDLENLKFEIHK